MSERITQELRDATTTGVRLSDYNGNVLEETLSVLRMDFESRCDAIDSIHANLERENDRLKCELDRVLGELDEMHKTDGISDNSSDFMHNEKRSIGSAVVTITDELREFARRWPCTDYIHKDMLAIADRIDAEHQRQLDVLYRDMSDAEWVRLPLDADGEPIHIGDVVEWSDGSTCEVVGIGDGGTLYYMDEMEGTICWTNADGKRHHRPDSWERIIKDALTMPIHSKADVTQFVARCKALAGDAE